MKILLKVHGFVQGVGYREYVRRMAERHNVNGYVRNLEDGSVEVFAEAGEHELSEFMRDIDVKIYHGPEVYKIERVPVDPSAKAYSGFVVL